MGRNHPINRLMKTHPDGAKMNVDPYKINLREAYPRDSDGQAERHLKRRVLVTQIYLRLIQSLAKRGVFDGETATIATTGMSMQVATASASDQQAAHQVMGELKVNGAPLYGYWGETGITETERQALTFLTSATSNIHFSYNMVDGMIEKKGRTAFRTLAERLIRPKGHELTPNAIFDDVIAIFRNACTAAAAELGGAGDVFDRKHNKTGESVTAEQLAEDKETAGAIFKQHLEMLTKVEHRSRAYATKPLDTLLAEIRKKAFGMD